jgi:chromosome partitioning protein
MKTTRRICISASKGGVGKTTTCVNLAHGLATAGYRVLVVDTDPQGNASAILLPDGFERCLYHLMVENAPVEEVVHQARENLDVIGSNEMVALINQFLVLQNNRELFLARRLEPLLEGGEYDYVLVDTSPSFSLLNITAYRACSEALIPVSMEYLSLVGVRQSLDHISILCEELGHDLSVSYIVPTMADARYSKTTEVLRMLKRSFKGVVTSPVHSNVKLSEAPSFGKTVFEYAPRSTGARDYQKLTDQIVKDNRAAAAREASRRRNRSKKVRAS